MASLFLAVFSLVGLLHIVHGLIGYDCGGSALNVTTMSIREIGECNVPTDHVNTKVVKIQLMQLVDLNHINVLECRVEINRVAYYCGMHSHISAVLHGRKEYVFELGDRQCKLMHETGSIRLFNAFFNGIQRNATTYHQTMLAGSNDQGGSCEGASYSDPYGSWNKVFVDANIKFTLYSYTAAVKLNEGKVLLRDGTRCSIEDRQCNNGDGATSYWEPVISTSCSFNNYASLYKGPGNRISSKSSPDVFSVVSQETTFALTSRGFDKICGYEIISTEHPKLFIIASDEKMLLPEVKKITADNMDIFAYVNSKIVYVEKHVRTQMEGLYRDVLIHRCELEKQVLHNALLQSNMAPEDLAYAIKKSLGYYAIISGEIIHLIKCAIVPVKIRKTEQCYQELPVTLNDAEYYLKPRSRSLVKKGTIIDCDPMIPIGWNIDGLWYYMTPDYVRAPEPQTIQPGDQPTWKYETPHNLASSGIYSEEDLNRLRNRIMFSAETPAVLNNIARGASGQPIPRGTVNMIGLMDEEVLTNLADSTAQRIWGGFKNFGAVSAGILTIIGLIGIAKMVVDSLIHGYALHQLYGWSIHMLGAVWSTVANLLIHRGHAKRARQDIENQFNLDNVNKNDPPTTKPVAPPRPPPIKQANAEGRYAINTLHKMVVDELQTMDGPTTLRGVDPILLSKLKQSQC